MALGWSRRDAEHLCVVELALDTAPMLTVPDRKVLARHVSTALAWEPVHLGAQALYCEREDGEGWRALSAAAEPPWDDVMARLAAAADRCDVVPLDDDMMRELIHPDNVRHEVDALRAEARGDFESALASLAQAIRPVGDTWRAELEFLQRQGDELAPAQWGRYLCGAAWRWGKHTECGLGEGMKLAQIVLEALGAPQDLIAQEMGKRLAWDQLIHDTLLFDHGLLDHYLNEQLAPRLLDRVPGIGSWVLARPTICELAGPVDGGALLLDLRTGADVVLGDPGLAADHPSGRLFYGRLVEVEGDERSFFATLPTILDLRGQAEQVLEVLENGGDEVERLRALYRPMSLQD